ncbi:MAG: hypothetical protein ACK5I7_06705 [Anaerotignum sp.]
MKKYFEVKPSLEDLKDKIIVLHNERDDRKTVFIVLGIIAVVLAATALSVVYVLKTKMDDEYDEDWDFDWDNLEDECCCDDDCCCTDRDVDSSVKVEQV